MSVSEVDSGDSSAGLDGGAFWGNSSLLTDLAFGSTFILTWKKMAQGVLSICKSMKSFIKAVEERLDDQNDSIRLKSEQNFGLGRNGICNSPGPN